MSQNLMKLIAEKFRSGNNIEVERITITRTEYESVLTESKYKQLLYQMIYPVFVLPFVCLHAAYIFIRDKVKG